MSYSVGTLLSKPSEMLRKRVTEEIYSALEDSQERRQQEQDLADLLEKEREKYNLSQRQLSNALSLVRRSLQRILKREAQSVDLRTFIKIQQFLGIPAEELLNNYISGLEPEDLKEIELAKKAGFIARNFDLEGLRKAGFLESDKDFSAIDSRIKKYFGYESVIEYGINDLALFSSTKRTSSNQMLRFWINSAVHQVRSVENPNDYDRDVFLEIIPGLRALTRDEENGLVRAARALYSAGLTVVVQKYLYGTQIRGATFVIDGKPAIVLTDFNKRYDTIWFALLHELYHVLKDFDRIQKIGYHLTGEPDMFIHEMTEKEANQFASEFLLPSERKRYIERFIDVPGVVRDHAERWNIHPAIIYGAYMWEHGEQEKYRTEIPSPDKAVQSLRIHPWDKETIEEAIRPVNRAYT